MFNKDYLVAARNVKYDRGAFEWIVMFKDMAALGVSTGGASYDYRAQAWRDNHDHAHVEGTALFGETVNVLYCGADFETCQA